VSLNCEPASEPRHISVKQLFSKNWGCSHHDLALLKALLEEELPHLLHVVDAPAQLLSALGSWFIFFSFFSVWDLGFGVWGVVYGVWGSGFGVWGMGVRVWGLRVEGVEFRVQGFGWRVEGSKEDAHVFG